MVTNEMLPPNVKSLPIITFSATAVESTGYIFKNWHYAVLQIHWMPDCFKSIDIYANNGCTMFMINGTYFQTLPVWKDIKIKRMVFKIPIRGISTQIHYSNEFVVVIFYLKFFNAVKAIIRKLHIVDDLKAKMLLGTDVTRENKPRFRFPANDYWEL